MKSQVKPPAWCSYALAIALGLTGCGAHQDTQAFNTLQPPPWIGNETQQDADHLDDPINHEQHYQLLLSGNYSDCYQDREGTAIALYRACYDSVDLLYAVLANYPSILQRYDIDVPVNQHGCIDPNQIKIYLAAAKKPDELRENLLLELWGLLASDDTTFNFHKENLKKKQSGYVYAYCWTSAINAKREEPHYVLREISQISDYVVEITASLDQDRTETGRFLLGQGFAPFYEKSPE